MPRRAAARVVKPAIDRETGLFEIQIGQHFAHALAVQQDCVIALVDHGIAAPHKGIALAIGMEEVDQAALRMHHVVIQLGFHAFPQLHRMAVEFAVALQEIVGAHDGGVAPDVAGPEIALFQHGDIGQAVVLGEVKGRGKAVAAAADDDRVIAGLGGRIAPCGLPALVAEKALCDDLQARIAHRSVPVPCHASQSASGRRMQPPPRKAIAACDRMMSLLAALQTL